jgi:putative endonuclease
VAGVSKGAAGEVLAARFLREKGYQVIGANYRTRQGEIDIIACDRTYILFVEVKTREEDSLFAPREAVTAEKQRRIVAASLRYLQERPTTLQPRYDVIEIITRKNRPMDVVEWDHIQGAYEVSGYASF